MSFQMAKLKGRSTPPTLEKPVAAGAAFEDGALLLADANNEWAECGADPASIGAVALSAYGADSSGFNRLGTKEFPPGYMQGMLVQDEVVFSAEYVGALPAADGGSYGLVRDTDGRWKVDFGEAVNTRVKLVGRLTDSPENRNRVLIVFLAANVQLLG